VIRVLPGLALGVVAFLTMAPAARGAAPEKHHLAAAPGDLTATLRRATQALADAVAPGERAVWEHYTDPAFTYVTEDNEVKSRSAMLDDLKPLPPGSSGWITVEEFRCTEFGGFAVTTYVLNEHESIEGHELHARYRASDTWRATDAGWRLAAGQVYAIPQDPPRTELPGAQLAQYEGSYSLSPATRQLIRRDGDHLVAERDGRAPQVLLPESTDVFFTPGRPRTRRLFTRAPDGQVNGFAERREGTDLIWTRLAPVAMSH
jgi:ketosteroid isomerase-like protein